MEVKIGIVNINREVTMETEETAQNLAQRLEKSITSNKLFEISDTRGRKIYIVPSHIAYLDLGTETARKVGFGTI